MFNDKEFNRWIAENHIRTGRKAVIVEGEHKGKTVVLTGADIAYPSSLIGVLEGTKEKLNLSYKDLSLLPEIEPYMPLPDKDSAFRALAGKEIVLSPLSLLTWVYREYPRMMTPRPIKLLEYKGRTPSGEHIFLTADDDLFQTTPEDYFTNYEFTMPIDGSRRIGRRAY